MARIILLRITERYFLNRPKSSFIFRGQEVLLQGQAGRQAIEEETFVSSVLSLQKLFTLMAERSFTVPIFLFILFPLLGNNALHTHSTCWFQIHVGKNILLKLPQNYDTFCFRISSVLLPVTLHGTQALGLSYVSLPLGFVSLSINICSYVHAHFYLEAFLCSIEGLEVFILNARKQEHQNWVTTTGV